MPTYTVQLDGLLTASNTTQGAITLAMYDQLYNFLVYNSASLGTQLIAYGDGLTFTGDRVTDYSDGAVISGDPGCGYTPRKGTASYWWNVSHGGNVGKWFCVRFASASVPFDVFIHYYTGSMTRGSNPTTTVNLASGESIPYVNNVTVGSFSALYSVDCPPLNPTPGGPDYTVFSVTITGLKSYDSDYSVTSRTGFHHIGRTPTTSTSSLRGGALSIQIAQRADGAGAWGLASGNQTGLFLPPVGAYASASLMQPNQTYHWSSGSSRLGIFPISNILSGGAHVTSSRNLFPIVPDNGVNATLWQMRYHLYASPNDIFIVTSDYNFSSSYRFCYFGKYDKHKIDNPTYPLDVQVPYVFAATLGTNESEPMVPTNYGYVNGTYYSSWLWGTWQGNRFAEGGVWYPTASNGVAAMLLELPHLSRNPILHPNKLVTPFAYDTYRPCIWISGTASVTAPFVSYLGQMPSLMKVIAGGTAVNSHDRTSDNRFVVVGNSDSNVRSLNLANASNEILRQKMVVPWNGATVIGTNNTASGLTGSIVV